MIHLCVCVMERLVWGGKCERQGRGGFIEMGEGRVSKVS